MDLSHFLVNLDITLIYFFKFLLVLYYTRFSCIILFPFELMPLRKEVNPYILLLFSYKDVFCIK